jgi:hypothetical protein
MINSLLRRRPYHSLINCFMLIKLITNIFILLTTPFDIISFITNIYCIYYKQFVKFCSVIHSKIFTPNDKIHSPPNLNNNSPQSSISLSCGLPLRSLANERLWLVLIIEWIDTCILRFQSWSICRYPDFYQFSHLPVEGVCLQLIKKYIHYSRLTRPGALQASDRHRSRYHSRWHPRHPAHWQDISKFTRTDNCYLVHQLH